MNEKKVDYVEKDKDNRVFWLKFITGFIFAGAIIFLIGMILNDNKIILPLTIVIISGLLFVFSIFSKNLAEKFQKKEEEQKEPKAIGKEKVKQIVYDEVENMMDNIQKDKILNSTRTINKNTIYTFTVTLNLENEDYYIIINANHPEKSPTVVKARNMTELKLNELQNYMAQDPKDPPKQKISEVVDPFTGRTSRNIEEVEEKKEKENVL